MLYESDVVSSVCKYLRSCGHTIIRELSESEKGDDIMNLLKTLKSNRPKYSELFIDGPFGQGIVRLVVDPYSYYVYTSDAREASRIEEMIKSGLTYNQAILRMMEG